MDEPMEYWEVIYFIKMQMEKMGITNRKLSQIVRTNECNISRYLSESRNEQMPFEIMEKCLNYFGYGFTIFKKDKEEKHED